MTEYTFKKGLILFVFRLGYIPEGGASVSLAGFPSLSELYLFGKSYFFFKSVHCRGGGGWLFLLLIQLDHNFYSLLYVLNRSCNKTILMSPVSCYELYPSPPLHI